MALQHLRSSTANKRPVPGNMSEGQLALNSNNGSPGLFFRDSNSNLVKVGPVHVGTTAPNASPASGGTAGNSVGEQWLDTTGGTYVFKVWDGSAWRSESGTFVDVNGDVMTGALGIIAGSDAAPGLYVSGDANTGLYSPGADQLAISTGGSGRLFVDASGTVTAPGKVIFGSLNNIGGAFDLTRTTAGVFSGFRLLDGGTNPYLQTGAEAGIVYLNADGSSVPAISIRTGTIERLRITSTGQLSHIGAGTSGSPAVSFNGSAPVNSLVVDSSGRLLVGTSSTSGVAKLQIQGYVGADTGFGIFALRIGSTPAVDQTVGRVDFNDSDDLTGARITAARDTTGTWSASSKPSRLVFSTTAGGTSSPTERMRITSDAYVRLASGTGGIQFNGDTAAANALDDYEEGTFTPTIVGTSTAGTATYGANGQVGRYTKIGNRVFFDLYLAWSAHTGTGDLQINGLPFTVQNTTNLNRTYSTIFSSLTLTAGSIGAAFSSPNTTTIALRQLPTGGGAVATIPMDTSAQISISGSFDV
jgi:hypothetical protein